ncbi:hypothetical protein EV714DRAFT_220951, partial [Schizophyllum commune]
SSTRNTRIERLWVEVGRDFARAWRAFFFRLEAQHQLRRDDPRHLWLLHYLFLGLIDADCRAFQANHNNKPISGAGHDQTPADMRLEGMLSAGYYVDDDCAGVSVEDIQRYYGCHGAQRQHPRRRGAGHDEDDEDDAHAPAGEGEDGESTSGELEDMGDLDQYVEGDNDPRFHLEPIHVPKHAAPFSSDDSFHLFLSGFEQAEKQGLLPANMNIRQEEWEGGVYPSFEIIRSGRKGKKELRIALPDSVWRSRAETWCRALFSMNHVLYQAMDYA